MSQRKPLNICFWMTFLSVSIIATTVLMSLTYWLYPNTRSAASLDSLVSATGLPLLFSPAALVTVYQNRGVKHYERYLLINFICTIIVLGFYTYLGIFFFLGQ